MLDRFKAVTTIPVVDLDRAAAFYEKTLGLVRGPTTPHSARFNAGGGTQISLFKRGATKADHTVAHFEVDYIDAVVTALRARGVELLEYDSGPLKTVNSIAELGANRKAWLKDTEGNILGLFQGVQGA